MVKEHLNRDQSTVEYVWTLLIYQYNVYVCNIWVSACIKTKVAVLWKSICYWWMIGVLHIYTNFPLEYMTVSICSTTLNLKTRLQIYISFCIPISSYFYTNSCKSRLNHTIQCLQTSNWNNWQTSNWDNWQTSNWS
jgi:hypothetical protein